MVVATVPSRSDAPSLLRKLNGNICARWRQRIRALLGTMLAIMMLVSGGESRLALRPVHAQSPQKSPVVPLGVTEIAPGVFVHQGAYAIFAPSNRGDVANLSFVIGRDAVAVIDTGGSAAIGRALRAAIRAVTDKPIRYVINTHMHPDHVFGNAAFADDQPEFIGHHKLARALAARAERFLAVNAQLLGPEAFAGTRLIAPTRAVHERSVIDLGARELILEAQPTAHTDNDLTIHDTATGTLFLGDLLFVRHVPALDGSIRGWLTLIGRLEQVAAKRAVPGHGPPAAAWPEAIRPQKQYLQRISADVRRMIKEGRSIAEAAATVGLSERDAWVLFDEFNARNVTAAFAELEWE
jgi:quinoprotein relay system zinc metallohydrolase 2